MENNRMECVEKDKKPQKGKHQKSGYWMRVVGFR